MKRKTQHGRTEEAMKTKGKGRPDGQGGTPETATPEENVCTVCFVYRPFEYLTGECCWKARGTNCILLTRDEGRATSESKKAQKDVTEDKFNDEENRAQRNKCECQIYEYGCWGDQPRTQEEWKARMAEAQLFQDTHDELGNCVAHALWGEPEDARPKVPMPARVPTHASAREPNPLRQPLRGTCVQGLHRSPRS